jgi:hypothetical protein
LQVALNFKDGKKAFLDFGNYSNKLYYCLEIVNQKGHSGQLDNFNRIILPTIGQMSLNNRESLVFENPGLVGGYQINGYQGELDSFIKCVRLGITSQSDILKSERIYKIIQEILIKINK